jgi:hypothetical protein
MTFMIFYLVSLHPIFFFFFWGTGFELRAYTMSHSTSHFCDGFFQDRVLWTIFSGWLWTLILLIPSSWVARIIGVSHWCLASTHSWPNCISCSPASRRTSIISFIKRKSMPWFQAGHGVPVFSVSWLPKWHILGWGVLIAFSSWGGLCNMPSLWRPDRSTICDIAIDGSRTWHSKLELLELGF